MITNYDDWTDYVVICTGYLKGTDFLKVISWNIVPNIFLYYSWLNNIITFTIRVYKLYHKAYFKNITFIVIHLFLITNYVLYSDSWFHFQITLFKPTVL